MVAVGDPDRARLLSGFLDSPRLVNSRRCLLVYTGEWKGIPVTVATHGVGAGSAGIVFEELAMLGAEAIVRLGTAGGLPGRVNVGDIVVSDSAVTVPGGCGTGQYSPSLVPPLAPDPRLTVALINELSRRGVEPVVGPVFCSDAFYAESGYLDRLSRLGVVAVEMESAILYTVARLRGLRSAAVFLVSNVVGGGEFYTTEELAKGFELAFKAILDVLVD